MTPSPPYRRVLIKLSGETLCSPGQGGIDPAAMELVVAELTPLREMGIQIAIVIGAGNILRGRNLAENPYVQRVTADTMGMLATVMNALALRDALEHAGHPARVLSALPMARVCEPLERHRAISHLQDGHIVILAGGTGRPFFTTDTGAAVGALEIGADIFFKATKVAGVYDADPVTHPEAKKFDHLTYQDVLDRRLGVLDLTAISLCMDNDLPIQVFALSQRQSLAAAVRGEAVGTRIDNG